MLTYVLAIKDADGFSWFACPPSFFVHSSKHAFLAKTMRILFTLVENRLLGSDVLIIKAQNYLASRMGRNRNTQGQAQKLPLCSAGACARGDLSLF